MSKKCSEYLALEDLAFYYGMFLFLPLFCVNLLYLTENRVNIFKVPKPTRTYFELKNSEKLARTVLFFLPTLFLMLLNYYIDNLIATTVNVFVRSFIFLIFLFIFAIGIWLALPLAYLKFDLLLMKEYPLTKMPVEKNKAPKFQPAIELSPQNERVTENIPDWKISSEGQIAETKSQFNIMKTANIEENKTKNPVITISPPEDKTEIEVENIEKPLLDEPKDLDVLTFKKISQEHSDSNGESNGEGNGEDFDLVESPEPKSAKRSPENDSP